MTWKTTFEGTFAKFDAQTVVAGLVIAPTSLPAPRGNLNSNAEQIMIQAHEDNPGVLVISKTASLPAGFRLGPGGSQVLPDNSYLSWKVYATLPACSFTVVYVAGPK